MKKLDWYLLKRYLGTFMFAILVLALISCVIDYSEKVDAFVKMKTPTIEILNYFKNFVPYMVAFLFPLFIFIATIFFTSQLANKSEIIAILSAGVSFRRFLRPYLFGAGLLCGVSLLANHVLVPIANKQRIAFENKYINTGSTILSERNVHLRLSPNLSVYLQSYDYSSNIGYRFTAEEISGTELKQKLMADRVSYDSVKKTWTLYSVVTRVNNGLQEELRFDAQLIKQYPFTPKDLDEDNGIMATMTTNELNKVIAREKLRGRENLNYFYIEKYRRTAQPFAGLILTIIAVCISSRKVRGGSGIHLAIGIVISAMYMMALQFANTFSTKGGLDPLIATWIPNIIFGTVAVYLFRRQIR